MNSDRRLETLRALSLCSSFAVMLMLTAARTVADDAADVLDKVKPSLVVIESYAHSGEKLGSVIGFSVEQDSIATSVRALQRGQRFVITRSDGSRVTAMGVWAFDRENDLVLVEVSSGQGSAIPTLPLEEKAVKDGSTVYALGISDKLKFHVATGFTRSPDRQLSELLKQLPGVRAMQAEFETKSRMSGGPWVNSSGKVVGIHQAELSAVANPELSVATPVKSLQPLLGQRKSSLLPIQFFSVPAENLNLLSLRPNVAASRIPIVWTDNDVYLHAPGRLEYSIPSGVQKLTAQGEIRGTGAVQFVVKIDEKEVFRSPTVQQGGSVPIEVTVPPESVKIELITDPLGSSLNDWAYWCRPRFE